MQRALLGGLLTGTLGGLLGSFAVLRQLSFFSDALGHSALLGLNPTLVLIPFAVVFALLVSLRAQVLVTLHADLAGAFGVGNQWHRIAFILLLAVLVAVSTKAVGLLGSGLTNLPSGPCVVIVQFFGFLLALAASTMPAQASASERAS
ncbi:MAG: metal ABC transporter permease [Aphanothece saxicola GSE-SYN-MK-01-06B]|nr:metal ABC transporter permease [Aphanothece saxicola GSE-SYN-MK-01-06B]